MTAPVYSEAVTIADKIKTFLEGSAYLTFIKKVSMFEDELEVEQAGFFPYINIDIQDMRAGDADNQDARTITRKTYPIILVYGNRHEMKQLIKKGDSTSSFKGLFDIYDAIWASIKADHTLGGAVRSVLWNHELASEVVQHSGGGQFWTGRAALMFEAYKDIFLK